MTSLVIGRVCKLVAPDHALTGRKPTRPGKKYYSYQLLFFVSLAVFQITLYDVIFNKFCSLQAFLLQQILFGLAITSKMPR